MSEMTVFLADKDYMRKMIRDFHDMIQQKIDEADFAMSQGRFRVAEELYFDAYTVFRDCLLPILDTWVSWKCEGCECRPDSIKCEKEFSEG